MPIENYLGLLKVDGTLVQVGVPEGPLTLPLGPILGGRRRLAGSMIGSPTEIHEMLKLAAEKKVHPWVEKRPMKDANQSIVDMNDGKARFRYVLVNN